VLKKKLRRRIPEKGVPNLALNANAASTGSARPAQCSARYMTTHMRCAKGIMRSLRGRFRTIGYAWSMWKGNQNQTSRIILGIFVCWELGDVYVGGVCVVM